MGGMLAVFSTFIVHDLQSGMLALFSTFIFHDLEGRMLTLFLISPKHLGRECFKVCFKLGLVTRACFYLEKRWHEVFDFPEFRTSSSKGTCMSLFFSSPL